MKFFLIACTFTAAVFIAGAAHAIDYVSFKRGTVQRLTGKVLIEAEDGGVLFQTSDGVLHTVQGDEMEKRTTDNIPFAALTTAQLAEKMLAEAGDGFKVHTTAHYVICYNTSQAYAQWCGGLYERLYRAFHTYWTAKGFELHEPSFAMPAMVFDTRAAYVQYATREFGEAAGSTIGYYSLKTNRVAMYDLTGAAQLRGRGTVAQVNRLLMLPGAERTVATIVHEATHQLAFNCGLQTRYADLPMWLNEGIAMYFETPDLRSSKGWRNIGGVNRTRLPEFRLGLRNRAGNALENLIGDNARFRDTKTAQAAYAEAWALTYFLLRHHPEEFVAYLKKLAARQPLEESSPAQRIADFKAAFGEKLGDIDTSFIRAMRRVR